MSALGSRAIHHRLLESITRRFAVPEALGEAWANYLKSCFIMLFASGLWLHMAVLNGLDVLMLVPIACVCFLLCRYKFIRRNKEQAVMDAHRPSIKFNRIRTV